MPLVNIMVNQRAYTIACDEGEEEHLRDLSKHVDIKVRELLGTVGQVGDARLLLMAALLITDDYFDALAQRDQRARLLDDVQQSRTELLENVATLESTAGDEMEAATQRIGELAARFAEA